MLLNNKKEMIEQKKREEAESKRQDERKHAAKHLACTGTLLVSLGLGFSGVFWKVFCNTLFQSAWELQCIRGFFQILASGGQGRENKVIPGGWDSHLA